jgi:hypothetical protein
VLAGIFVGLFIEFSDEFFKDSPHRMVVHTVGVKVNRAELLYQQEEQALLVQQVDVIPETEVVDDIPHVLGKPIDVRDEVLPDVLGVVQELAEIELGNVVKGMPSGPAQLAIQVLDSLLLEVFVPGENLFLGACQYAIQSAKHREGQNHIGILASLEVVPKNLIGYRPNEIDYLLGVLGQWTLLTWCSECPQIGGDELLRL